MLTLLAIGLILFLIFALFVGLLAVSIVQQQGKMNDLRKHGVEVTATVEQNHLRKGFSLGFITVASKPAQWRRELVYRYTDSSGQSHVCSHSDTAGSELASLEVGSSVQVIYSEAKPNVSAPKYVVGQAKSVR